MVIFYSYVTLPEGKPVVVESCNQKYDMIQDDTSFVIMPGSYNSYNFQFGCSATTQFCCLQQGVRSQPSNLVFQLRCPIACHGTVQMKSGCPRKSSDKCHS